MNSNPEPQTVEVTVEACCEACAKTHLMVAQIHGLIDSLMNHPMAGAMFGAPPVATGVGGTGGHQLPGNPMGGLFAGIPPLPHKG